MFWKDVWARQERRAQRLAQDQLLAERHAMFDAQAKDHAMRYDRPSFSVPTHWGEAFRRGYDQIDWSIKHEMPRPEAREYLGAGS